MIEASEYTFDLQKMFFGDFGIMIYIEIILRVFVIMLYTVLMIRWIGKRVVGGLGSSDILIIVAMGSSVGDATFYPSIPLAVSIAVITLIALFQKLYVSTEIKYEAVRKLSHPKITKLVENGKLLKNNFKRDDIDENEVYMLLRQQGIEYLSEIKNAYYEESGLVSIYKFENPILKDSILPENIEELELIK